MTDRRELALALFDIGGTKFGAFKLKLHETQPDAPLSPIYLNLRTPDNPKPGPLTPEIFRSIGQILVQTVADADLRYDAVVGIPNAGNPFVEAFLDALPPDVPRPPRLHLEKMEEAGKRRITRIIEGASPPEGIVLPFDDLVTQADTKLEATDACRHEGLRVTDLVVFVDREQGGEEELLRHDVRLTSVFKLSWLMDLYVEAGRMDSEKREEVLTYIAANRAPTPA